MLGEPALPYYYGPDQLGSVRRAFASTSSAPAYSYDPYGNPLQTTAPVTDFVYAGMFYNADSGLYLTMYRAYNPAIGRWLSRDPIGESSNRAANLYAYVNNQPLNLLDPFGLDAQYSIGIGGTVALFVLGVGGSVNVGINVPDTLTNVGGYQLFITAQANAMGGAGAYLGYGFSASRSTTNGPLPLASGSIGWYAEGDIGFGPSVSASIQGNPCGVTGGSASPLPRVGAGYGLWVGVGGNASSTLATPTVSQIYNTVMSVF